MNPTYEKLKKLTDDPIEEVLQSVRVLFADDNIETLTLMEMYARELGWDGVFVATALGIVDAINESANDESKGFDAIVADINFKTDGPEVTGITVARTIRKVRPDIPIIFVTAYLSSIIREEVRRVNAEVVAKPVDYVELFHRVAQLIYWHRLTTASIYEGPDRRKSSINTSGWTRRKTDKALVTSQIVLDTLKEGASNGNGQ